MAKRPQETAARQTFAWHGWRLELPAEWNPLRIDGDFAKGSVLFADLTRHRLALRWSSVRDKRFDADEFARRAIRAEAGLLAAGESRSLSLPSSVFAGSRLYEEPDPPGRDLWVAHSPATGRVVELIYHAARRDRVLAESIVPALSDDAELWSVFDLRCTMPQGMRLLSHQLRAGDLKLSFTGPAGRVSVRQIAVARLALARMPLERWLAKEQEPRHYRVAGQTVPLTIRCNDGRELTGIAQELFRRRRFFFLRHYPPHLVSAALHDAERDRLVLLAGSDAHLLQEIARSVGAEPAR